jgi:hypothetical protein
LGGWPGPAPGLTDGLSLLLILVGRAPEDHPTGDLPDGDRHVELTGNAQEVVLHACRPHLRPQADAGGLGRERLNLGPDSIGFSGRQRSLDCQRRLPLYFPCAPSSQLRNLSENNLNNIRSLKIYHLIRGNLPFRRLSAIDSLPHHRAESRPRHQRNPFLSGH